MMRSDHVLSWSWFSRCMFLTILLAVSVIEVWVIRQYVTEAGILQLMPVALMGVTIALAVSALKLFLVRSFMKKFTIVEVYPYQAAAILAFPIVAFIMGDPITITQLLGILLILLALLTMSFGD